jgi:hypothetical protein
MSDEKKKISLLIPADLFKEITDLGKAAKASETAGEKAAVVLEASPEQTKYLTELRKEFEASQLREVDEWQTLADRFTKSSELRISFYERLILLAGGSFALSLTYLGSLQRHASQNTGPVGLIAIGWLKAAWILLLACIVLSWLHNFFQCSSVDYFTAFISTNAFARRRSWESNAIRRLAILFKGMESSSAGFGSLFEIAAQVVGLSGKKQEETSQGHQKNLKRFYHRSILLGILALLAIALAFAFMVVFAVKNATML